MGEVLVPGVQHPAHAVGLGGAQRDGGPVDVPDRNVAARAQGAVDLGEGRGYVGYVFEHLDAESGVEVGVTDRERGGIAFDELGVRGALITVRCEREHGLAAVDADDRALWANLLEGLGDVEARAAADVEDPVPRSRADRLANQGATAQHVAR